MAGTVKGIIVEIGGDTSGLQKALSKINSVSSGLSKELRGINSLLKLDPSNTILLKQKQEALAESIATTKEKLKSLKDAQEQADNVMIEGGEINQENYRALQREIVATENKLNALKLEASNWNKAGDALIEFGEKISTISQKIETLGTNLTTKLTLPVVALAGGVTKVTGDFDSSMKKVAATMGITVDEIEKGSESYKILEDAAKKCGEETKYSASEAADALNYLALAGYDAKKSAEVLPKVLNLAAAGDLELATASDMVTDAMAALNMETKDLDKYINEMAKTSQKSNTSVGQLGEATLTCAGTVKLANMSLETMNTELGILANNGIKGAEGGTHLRNIILSLTSPTDTAAKALKNLGIKVTDNKGNIRDLNDIMGDFNKKLDGMSDGKKTNIISTIFNKTDISAVNALIKGSGQEFSNLKAQISNCGNAAQDMADTMNSSLQGQVTLLKSQIEGISIKLGNKLMPTVKKGIKGISSLADSFSKLSDEEVENVIKTAAFVAAVGPALTIVGKIGTGIGKTTTTMGNLIKATANVTSGVTASQAALNGASNTTVLFTKYLAKLLSPAGLATTAILALTAAGIYYAQKQQESLKQAQEYNQAVKDSKEAYDEYNKSIADSANAEMSHLDYIIKLKNELNQLVDENGKVKEGYEGRASFILNELNNALGTEYKLNENIIESYQELQGSIDELVRKKKAEIALNAEEEQYTNAIKNQTEAVEKLNEIQGKMGGTYENSKKKYDDWIQSIHDAAEAQDAEAMSVAASKQQEMKALKEYLDAYETQESIVKDCVDKQKQYENDYALFAEGKYDEIGKSIINSTKTWSDSSLSTIHNSITTQSKELNRYKEIYERTGNEVAKQSMEQAQQNLQSLGDELVARTTTIDTLGEDEINAWRNLSIQSYDVYVQEISKMSPEMQAEIKRVTGIIDGDTTIQYANGMMAQRATSEFATNDKISEKASEEVANTATVMNTDTSVNSATGMMANRATSEFANNNNISQKMQEEVNATANVENSDTSIGSGASRLANEADNNFNNNVDGHKWGADLTDNISSGIISKIASVAIAAAKVAGTIASYLHHSVPDQGPLADEMSYMPDMIDNLTKTLIKSSPKLEKASFDVAEKMARNLNLGQYQSALNAKVIDSTKTVFTTPQINVYTKELNKSNLEQCFNYINRKFGSKY